MKAVIKAVMDMIYNAKGKVKKYKATFPEEEVVAFGACKGIQLNAESDVSRGTHWTTAKRALFILTDQKIVLGNWEIPLQGIEKSELMVYRSGMILKITEVEGRHHQFGLQYDKVLIDQNVLPIECVEGKMKYSFFSLFMRGFALFFLIKMVIEIIKPL